MTDELERLQTEVRHLKKALIDMHIINDQHKSLASNLRAVTEDQDKRERELWDASREVLRGRNQFRFFTIEEFRERKK